MIEKIITLLTGRRRDDVVGNQIIIKDGVIVSGGDIGDTTPETDQIATETERRDNAQRNADYWSLAQELCAKKQREGIWIALSLLGVRVSAIEKLEIALDSEAMRILDLEDEQVITIDAWLYSAMSEIANWRMKRNTIHKGLVAHNTNSRDLMILGKL